MAQSDILNFLKENKHNKFTTKEIYDSINKISIGSIGANLRKLRQDKRIKADYIVIGNHRKYLYYI